MPRGDVPAGVEGAVTEQESQEGFREREQALYEQAAADNFAINRLLQERYGKGYEDDDKLLNVDLDLAGGKKKLHLSKDIKSDSFTANVEDSGGKAVANFCTEFKGKAPRGSLELKLPDASMANFHTRVSTDEDGSVNDKRCNVDLMQVGGEYALDVEEDGLHIDTQETVKWSSDLRHANGEVNANGRVERYRARLRQVGEIEIEQLRSREDLSDRELLSATRDIEREYATGIAYIRDVDELKQVWKEAYRGALLKKKFPEKLDPGPRPFDRVIDPEAYLEMLGQATETLSEIKGALEYLQREK